MLHTHLSFPRAILFDLDDTLIDTDSTRRVVLPRIIDILFTHSCPNELYEIRQQAQKIMDSDPFKLDDILCLFLLKLSLTHPTTIEELHTSWVAIYINHVQPVKNLFAVLHMIKKMEIKLGIISNGTKHAQNKKIDTLGIRSLLDTIVISEIAGFRKPDPRIFRFALSELILKPSDAWYVGDDPINDIEGSSMAGMISIWMQLNRKWAIEHLLPHYQINSLAELPILLQRI